MNFYKLIKYISLISLTLFLFVSTQKALAANCSQQYINLSTQLEVDDFQATYGNGAICDTITGDLTISGGDIVNLNGLINLAKINQNLNIWFTSLANLSGLNALQTIVRSLAISRNPNLANFDGLNALSSVGGNVVIDNNDYLGNIDALSLLSSIGADLSIHDNSILVDVDGLSNLTIIGRSLLIYQNDMLLHINGLSGINSLNGNLDITRNNSLTQISGLSSLNSVVGGLKISSNPILLNINALTNLTGPLNYLEIAANPLLNNIDALSKITEIIDYLSLFDNTGILDINGLISITSVGGDLAIESNTLLPDLTGLASLASVGGSFSIAGNTNMVSLDGLTSFASGMTIQINYNNKLKNIDGLATLSSDNVFLNISNNNLLENINGLQGLDIIFGLELVANPMLQNLNGLSNLTNVANFIAIKNNDTIVSLDGLDNLISATEIAIENNPALLNMNGLENLSTIQNLTISNNIKLESLTGLSGLQTISMNLFVSDNPALSNFDGMTNLTKIDGYFTVRDNNNLLNFNGFSNLIYVGQDVEISANINLSNCAGLIPLVDQIDDGAIGPGQSGAPDVGGSVTFGFNMTGCNSTQDVLAQEASANLSVLKMFSDNNPANVQISLTCDLATVIVDVIDNNASISSPAEFIIHRFIPGYHSFCTATESPKSPEYLASETDCENLELTNNANISCTIFNNRRLVMLQVDIDYPDPRVLGDPEVQVNLNCPSGLVSPSTTVTTTNYSALFDITDYALPGIICAATQVLPVGYIQTNTSTCDVLNVQPGASPACTFTNQPDPGNLASPSIPSSNLNEMISGSCGALMTNGTVSVTSSPVNGFSNMYDAPVALDNNGNFTIINPGWSDGSYLLTYTCTNQNATETFVLGPFGPVIIDTTCTGTDLEITGNFELGDHLCEGTNSLTTSGVVNVNMGSNVYFRAPKVTLANEFSVSLGAEFSVTNNPPVIIGPEVIQLSGSSTFNTSSYYSCFDNIGQTLITYPLASDLIESNRTIVLSCKDITGQMTEKTITVMVH